MSRHPIAPVLRASIGTVLRGEPHPATKGVVIAKSREISSP